MVRFLLILPGLASDLLLLAVLAVLSRPLFFISC